MSHFYGYLSNHRNLDIKSRGFKKDGMTTQLLSWKGGIQTRIWHDKDNVDRFTIKLIPHPSSQAGKEIEIATGKLDGSELITVSQDYFNSRL